MSKFGSYNIPLKTMEIGESVFEYRLDNDFFEAIGEESLQKGNLTAKVRVVKSAKQSELHFDLEGKVVVLCDRCLEEMDQPIRTSGHLIVRMGKEFKDDGDDIVVIPEEQGVINVSWFMYEFIELAIPIKHVHPFGHCNTGMATKLSEHLVDSATYEDEEGMASNDDIDTESDGAGTDPRWDALKSLNLNSKD